jgi:lysyl-tRNA synthetase class 2
MKLRQRYVDLIMSEETREVFRRRSVLIRFIRSFLDTLDSPRSRRR